MLFISPLWLAQDWTHALRWTNQRIHLLRETAETVRDVSSFLELREAISFTRGDRESHAERSRDHEGGKDSDGILQHPDLPGVEGGTTLTFYFVLHIINFLNFFSLASLSLSHYSSGKKSQNKGRKDKGRRARLVVFKAGCIIPKPWCLNHRFWLHWPVVWPQHLDFSKFPRWAAKV